MDENANKEIKSESLSEALKNGEDFSKKYPRGSVELLRWIGEEFYNLEFCMDNEVSPCRALSVAKTKLEESWDWFKKAYQQQSGDPSFNEHKFKVESC